ILLQHFKAPKRRRHKVCIGIFIFIYIFLKLIYGERVRPENDFHPAFLRHVIYMGNLIVGFIKIHLPAGEQTFFNYINIIVEKDTYINAVAVGIKEFTYLANKFPALGADSLLP